MHVEPLLIAGLVLVAGSVAWLCHLIDQHFTDRAEQEAHNKQIAACWKTGRWEGRTGQPADTERMHRMTREERDAYVDGRRVGWQDRFNEMLEKRMQQRREEQYHADAS